MTQYIKNLGELCDRYDHFIIDIFGVLHDGIEPFHDTVRTLSALKTSGKQVCLLSNSPRRAHNPPRRWTIWAFLERFMMIS